MSAYNIIVNDVQKSNYKVLCLVRIDNYKKMLRNVSCGEYIRSEPIQLNFHDSIGKSTWMLLFYPKGQYIGSSDANLMESGRASIYLKMINCEHKDKSLATIITVSIKSPYSDFNDDFATTKYATLSYRKQSERWSGPLNLANVDELYSKRCKSLFLNDSLTIGCEIKDTTFRSSVPRTVIENKCVPAFRSSSGTKSVTYKEQRYNYASQVGSELNETRQSNKVTSDCDVQSDTSKENGQKKFHGRRNTITFQNDVAKENHNIAGKRSSLALRKDVLKENVDKNVCRCREPEQKISKETQTWDERLLRSCNNNWSSIEGETNEAVQISYWNNGLRIKDVIAFFEKCSLPRD